jgi:hypothetical protein
MQLIVVVMMVAALPSICHAETRVFRNSIGQETGRATTNGNVTMFSNPLGPNIGRSTTSNGTTTFYDAMGRRTGTTKPPGR